MKRLLFILIAIILPTLSFSQVRPSGNLGINFAYEPHDQYFYALQYGFNGSFGFETPNRVWFVGVGIGYEVEHEVAHDYGYREKANTNVVPIFFEASYTGPSYCDLHTYGGRTLSYYMDTKIGPAIFFDEDYHDSGLYFELSPLGISINHNNNFAVGYRLLHLNDYYANGIIVQYSHRF